MGELKMLITIVHYIGWVLLWLGGISVLLNLVGRYLVVVHRHQIEPPHKLLWLKWLLINSTVTIVGILLTGV